MRLLLLLLLNAASTAVVRATAGVRAGSVAIGGVSSHGRVLADGVKDAQRNVVPATIDGVAHCWGELCNGISISCKCCRRPGGYQLSSEHCGCHAVVPP